jgi:hypothetical protein
LTVIARIFNGDDFVGLALSDGAQTRNVPLAQCIAYASQGRIAGIKAVTRADAAPFLQGVGAALDSLPIVRL